MQQYMRTVSLFGRVWATKNSMNCSAKGGGGLDAIASYLEEAGMAPAPEKTKCTVFGRGCENKKLDLRFSEIPDPSRLMQIPRS